MKDSNSFHAVCLDSYPQSSISTIRPKDYKMVETINQQEVVAAYTFDAGPNAVIYYDEANQDKVLPLLYKHFGHVPGWKTHYTAETPVAGVSRIIQTSIGPGPQETSESLTK